MRVTTITLALLYAAVALQAQAPFVMQVGPHQILFAPGEEYLADRASRVIAAVSSKVTSKYGTQFRGFRADVRLNLPPAEMRSRSGPYTCCIQDVRQGVMISTTAYQGGLMSHEDAVELAAGFIPITYLAVQTERGRGWVFNDGPEWFIEGLAIFDASSGLALSPQQQRADFIRWKQQHSRTTECCGEHGRSLFLSEPGVGGAAFLAYLAERFGEDLHARILRSQAPSFTRAFAEETAPYSFRELFEGFTAWK